MESNHRKEITKSGSRIRRLREERSITDEVGVEADGPPLAVLHPEQLHVEDLELLGAEEGGRPDLRPTPRTDAAAMNAPPWLPRTGKQKKRRERELTGGPSSGGMMILRLPPGLMSRMPSSNPRFVRRPLLADDQASGAEEGHYPKRERKPTRDQNLRAHPDLRRSALRVGAVDAAAGLIVAHVVKRHLPFAMDR